MKSPHEMYVENVALALHGKYGGAGTPSWTLVKEPVREEWRRDARELLEEIQPDLRYITARGQDHHELSEALGVEPGLLEWHRLIELVREQRAQLDPIETSAEAAQGEVEELRRQLAEARGETARRYPAQGEFARVAATTDIVRSVLRILSDEYAEPYAHSDDDAALAEDMLLDAARRLVAARAGEDAMVGVSQLAESAAIVADADQVLRIEAIEPDPEDLGGLLSSESIQEGMAHGHPALYPLWAKSGRIVPKEEQ